MATINGITFNMRNLRPVAAHRNSVSEQPGSDTNFITDMGYDGLVLRLEGFEETLATYDSVISEFMKSGEQTLVHRAGWQFKVYSAQLTPELIQGFADNYFPYDLILYTSTPYRESTTLSCRAKSITANNQEWSAEDMPCDNLVENWSMEDWSAGVSSAPDGWTLVGGGATIARNSSPKVGTYCAALTRNGANCHIVEELSNYSNYQGVEITTGAWMKCSTASMALVRIYDGVGYSYSSFHTGGGDWEWLPVTRTIDTSATQLQVQLRLVDLDGTAYFDGIVSLEGDSIPDNTFIRDIDTDGSVDAVPDIQLTGGAVGATYNRDRISHEDLDATEYNSTSATYTLEKTFTYAADANRAHHLSRVGCEGRWVNTHFGDAQVRYSIAGAADVVIDTYAIDSNSYVVFSTDTDISTSVNESLEVKYYAKNDLVGEETRIKNLVSNGHELAEQVCKNPQIYNAADSTVKNDVANEIDPYMVFRINVDGTGTINYYDDYSTDKYLDAYWDMSGITHDTGNDELDIADDGYIYYKIDTKYPITGIPTLTSQINITAGTPTIQIAVNNGGEPDTFYDIDTAIVDDVSTVYELDDSTNLSLKGKTTFFLRMDCVKAAAATCSIKSFELNIDLITIDAEHPKITTGSTASTFRCDQHADSGLNCTVALHYRDRSWPA